MSCNEKLDIENPDYFKMSHTSLRFESVPISKHSNYFYIHLCELGVFQFQNIPIISTYTLLKVSNSTNIILP